MHWARVHCALAKRNPWDSVQGTAVGQLLAVGVERCLGAGWDGVVESGEGGTLGGIVVGDGWAVA